MLLYCREGLRCDLWCLVLRPGLEPVPAEYQPFDRVTSSSIRLTAVNLRTMKGYEGGIVVFIFNIFVGLSVQLRAPATLDTRKYSSVGLVVGSWISGSTQAVWTLPRTGKYLPSLRNRTTMTGHYPVAYHFTRGVQTDGTHTISGNLGI